MRSTFLIKRFVHPIKGVIIFMNAKSVVSRKKSTSRNKYRIRDSVTPPCHSGVANKVFGTVKNDSVSQKGREKKREDDIYELTEHKDRPQ